jgi:hypothetical protein
LEPFRAKAVAVWFLSRDNQWLAARCDLIISPEKKEAAPEPPVDSARAMIDLGYPFK